LFVGTQFSIELIERKVFSGRPENITRYDIPTSGVFTTSISYYDWTFGQYKSNSQFIKRGMLTSSQISTGQREEEEG